MAKPDRHDTLGQQLAALTALVESAEQDVSEEGKALAVKARELLTVASQMAADIATRTRDTVTEGGRALAEKAQSVASENLDATRNAITANPIWAIAGAAAFGASLGILLTRSATRRRTWRYEE